MKIFWCILLSLVAAIQIIGHWHFGKADPIPAILIIGYPTAIVLGIAFTWLFEKQRSGDLLVLFFMPLFCWDPLHTSRNETSLFQHGMAAYLDYDLNRLQGLVGSVESMIGGTIFIILTSLTFAASVYITASVFGFGFDGIERGGFAFLRKVFAKWNNPEEKKP